MYDNLDTFFVLIGEGGQGTKVLCFFAVMLATTIIYFYFFIKAFIKNVPVALEYQTCA